MIAQIPSYHGFNVTLQVTEACNLQCAYCYEIHKRPRNLPFEYAQKFIDLILTDNDPVGVRGTHMEWLLKQGLVIDFIGGDALMRPDFCDKVLQYFQYKAYTLNHPWKNRWRCSISTNGTFFGDAEVRRFLEKYHKNISLGVSVDGCPEIHNKNRSNSMDKILRHWDYYLWYAGEYANTKATLNKDSIPWIAKSIRYLHEELKLKHINMNFIFEDMHLVEEDYQEIEKQFEETIEYILEHRDDLHVNMFSKTFGIGGPCTPEMLEKGWCGAGAMPCLTVNGKIYPCFRFVPNTMHSDFYDFYCGDVWGGFTHKHRFAEIRNANRQAISPKECLECAIESSCAYCIGGAYAEKGMFFRQTNLCKIKHLIDKYSRLYWRAYDLL